MVLTVWMRPNFRVIPLMAEFPDKGLPNSLAGSSRDDASQDPCGVADDADAAPGVSAEVLWYHRLCEPQPSAATITAWLDWLHGAPDNADRYARVEALMRLSNQLGPVAWPDEEELLEDDYDGSVPVEVWRRRQVGAPLAAEAPRRPQRAPAVAQRRALYAAALAGLMLVGGTAAWWWSSAGPGVGGSPPLVYETLRSQLREIRLADGSSISLGARSRISVNYSARQRQVSLERGEVYFEVAKDPARPFVVASGRRSIIAVGTAFNVNRDESRVQVTVSEGRVMVTEDPDALSVTRIAKTLLSGREAPHRTLLAAGERIRYDGERIGDIVPADPTVATAWRHGRLQYLGDTLRSVVADVNRYADYEIRIDDARVADLRFTGSVVPGRIDAWLGSLQRAFPITVEHEAGGRIVVLAPAPGRDIADLR